MQASLSKEYCLSNKEALVPSLPPRRGHEVLPGEGQEERSESVWGPRMLTLPPEASESSLALVSRTNIKTFEILPIQANFRTSGSLNLQTGL